MTSVPFPESPTTRPNFKPQRFNASSNHDHNVTVGLLVPLTAEQFVQKRGAYSYPAVALVGSINGWNETCFSSTRQMDDYHHDLLTSHDSERTVMGYLSTVFWGHFSGQDGRARGRRAQAKVRQALNQIENGRAGGLDGAAGKIHEALAPVETNRCGEALRLLSGLPQLGPVFASKVCAFLAPTKCGVIDSIIAGKYSQFGFSVDSKGYVKRIASNLRCYDAYCTFLREQAESLNHGGDDLLWKDRDNTRQRWRAVDVERAIF